jgi:alkylhydroperoxidase family enzyme
MRAHLALYRELMFGRSELTRAEREMIAVAVSVVNHCHYCLCLSHRLLDDLGLPRVEDDALGHQMRHLRVEEA